MALSFVVKPLMSGKATGTGLRVHKVKITLDAAYVTAGGYAITAANLGFDSYIEHVSDGVVNALGVLAHFNPDTSKLVLRWTGASASAVLAEVGTNEASLDGKTVTLVAYGV